LEKNADFRRDTLLWAQKSEEHQQTLWEMCRRDPLFYINTFGWTYSPKDNPAYPNRPFITYGFQDDAIDDICENIGFHDVLLKKSRDMGATWLCLVCLEWRWHFFDGQSFLCTSRTEDLVDAPEDPDSLFWKLCYFIRKQPGWLQPMYTKTALHLGNDENGSTIDGCSTTSDSARGGRRTGIFLDEFASVPNGRAMLAAVADATNCRIFNSTPKGTGTAFYLQQKNPTTKKIELHWSRHPLKSAGLYCGKKDGTGFEYIDRKYHWPKNYPFIFDGKKRSPWYDEQCARRASKLEIAQELDMDDLASGSQWFDQDVLDSLIKSCAREPERGNLVIEDGRLKRFEADTKGFMQLWISLEANKPPSDRQYVIGGDISAGTGASNSSLSIGDISTHEKIGEYTRPDLLPEAFALHAVALAMWFNNAHLIWERNGPGAIFAKAVRRLGYGKVYYAKNEQGFKGKVSDVPGWMPTPKNKEDLLGSYRSALASSSFINRSKPALLEACEYVRDPSGAPAHAATLDAEDPSGARSQHGDRVIADALCYHWLKDFEASEPEKTGPEENTFAWRREESKRAFEDHEDGWDDKGNEDAGWVA
jgi:hypothetical protein